MSTDPLVNPGARLLEIALNYFYKHCPDPDAYFEDEDWSSDDEQNAHEGALEIIEDCK